MKKLALLLFTALLLLPLTAKAAGPYSHAYKDGDILMEDAVWSGRVLVDGVLFLPAGRTLTISPGTTVEFTRSDAEYRESGLSEAVIPGSGLRIEGVITALGGKDSWITFTSAEGEPEPGAWGCLFFDHAKGSEFRYCRFEYAKYTVHAHFSRVSVRRSEITKCEDGSRIGYSRAEFMNCSIHGNTGKGLNFANSRVTVAYCNITGNYEGVFLNQQDEDSVVRDNNIHGNTGMDLRLGEFHTTDISMAGNWWGTADNAAIARKVYDKSDDPEIGGAKLMPAKSPVPGAGVDGTGVETVWEFKAGGFVDSTPALADGRVYFGSWDKRLYCLDASTGELVWKFETGDCVDSSPAVHDGRVYFASWDRKVYCLNAGDGSLIWKFDMPPSNFDDHRQSSPLLWPEGNTLFIGGFNGKLYALDMETGGPKWEFETGGPIRTRPAMSGASVLVGSSDGLLYALDRLTGKALWKFDAGGKVFTTPAVAKIADGRYAAYFGTEGGALYSLDAATGDVNWKREIPGRFMYSSPLVTGGMAIAGDCNGVLHAYDTASGDEIWATGTGDVIYSPPALYNDAIIFGNNGGGVYFADTASGKIIAKYSVFGPVQAVFGAEDAVFVPSRDGIVRSIRLSD